MSESIVLVKYSDDLVFSFDKLAAKSDVSTQSIKDYIEFFRKRAEIEAGYAKQLAQHYKTTPGSSMFAAKDLPVTKEPKTLKDATSAVAEKGAAIAEAHQEVANKITSEIVKVLENWIKTKDAERKKVIGEGMKLIKSLVDAKANAAKNRAAYEKLMKDSDAAKDALIKAEKDEIAQPDNKKLQAVTKKATEAYQGLIAKGKTAETAYKTSVEKTNEELASFKSDKMPATLQQFQTWEQERWSALLAAVTSFKTIEETLPSTFEKYVTELQTLIDDTKLDSDLQEIVTACKNAKEEESIEFVQFKSKHEDDNSKPKEAEKPKEEKKEEAKEEKAAEPEKK